VPFPVRPKLMDRAVEVLRSGIVQSRLSDHEKREALLRLSSGLR